MKEVWLDGVRIKILSVPPVISSGPSRISELGDTIQLTRHLEGLCLPMLSLQFQLMKGLLGRLQQSFGGPLLRFSILPCLLKKCLCFLNGCLGSLDSFYTSCQRQLSLDLASCVPRESLTFFDSSSWALSKLTIVSDSTSWLCKESASFATCSLS